MGEVVPLRDRRDEPAERTEREPGRDRPRGRPRGRHAPGPEPLWRELVGDELRHRRQDRGERLVDVAERAGVSAQYLSEVERGLKDPSSEILAAVSGALELTMSDLLRRVSAAPPSGPVCLAA